MAKAQSAGERDSAAGRCDAGVGVGGASTCRPERTLLACSGSVDNEPVTCRSEGNRT